MKKAPFILASIIASMFFMSGCSGMNAFVAGENDIIINAGTEWELKGILTLPEGKAPFPAIVVVAGSGHDDDYTVLTDLLAKQGIASIRHIKRPTAYLSTIGVDFTIKEESVADALSAVALAKGIKKISPDKVFVLGHSQGGSIIPKINEADKENIIAGFICFAGSTRSPGEHIKEIADVMLLFPDMSEETKSLRSRGRLRQYEDIKNLTEADRGSKNEILGYYPTWWLDMADYNPAISAQNIKKPILFLQGSHDDNMLPDNMDVWKDATKNNQKAVYKFYSGLNHDLMRTEKFGGRAAALVDEEVIADITSFIKDQD